MAIVGHGLCFELLEAAHRKAYHLRTSREILEEVAEVLARPKFGLRSRQIQGALRQIVSAARIVKATETPKVVEQDADDDRVLACALSARARYLVTYDRHFLVLGSYKSVLFVTPEQFMIALTTEGTI